MGCFVVVVGLHDDVGGGGRLLLSGPISLVLYNYWNCLTDHSWTSVSEIYLESYLFYLDFQFCGIQIIEVRPKDILDFLGAFFLIQDL